MTEVLQLRVVCKINITNQTVERLSKIVWMPTTLTKEVTISRTVAESAKVMAFMFVG
jgi:hypothetical protein